MTTRVLLPAAFVILLCLALAPASCIAGGQGVHVDSSLNIGIHPSRGTGPVCFTLTDPAGRMMSTGPPCEGAELAEIPDAYQDYESIGDDETGAPGPVTRIIYVRHPMSGEYTLELSLPMDDSYDLEIQGTDGMGGVSHRLLTGIKSSPGDKRTYTIEYTDFPAAEVKVLER
jgi:hypothetical protein